MALTLEQILNPITVEDATQFMIDVLRSVGFSGAASWQSGSLARTVGIEVPARVMSNVHQIIVTYGKAGYNETAIGDWLTVFSVSQYDNQRHAPVKTQGDVRLASGDIAHSVGAGDMLFADAVTLRTYRNREAFTLPAGSEGKTIAVEAEVAGSASNVAINQITVLQTSYAGVTVNNPGVDGEWITQAGADAESDDSLRARNRTKWASKAYATPEAGYENYAREADPAITRVFVEGNPPDLAPGSVRIFIAGADNTSTADSAQEVLDYIEGVTDGICRRPLCAIVSCVPATERIITVTGTVFVAAAYAESVSFNVEKALDEFFETIPIGGTKTTGPGCVFFSALYMAVMQVPGVMNVVFTSPVGDVVLAPHEVPLESVALLYVVI